MQQTKLNCISFSRISTDKTRTLIPKSFVEKMKLKLPGMSHSFKTNQTLLRTQPLESNHIQV